MTPFHRPLPSRAARFATVAALFASSLTALPAFALYKVVGPDGKITYTDRPPVASSSKVQSVNTTTGTSVDASSLPYELQQVVRRYPVTLYTGSDCSACDSGRQLLRQRGVPFSERTAKSNEDVTALRRLTGKDEVPALTIGSQVVNGYAAEEWTTYLNAAGYPKTSRLPASYTEASATPLTEARGAAAPAPAPAPTAAPSPSPAAAPAEAPSGIRF